MGKIEKAKHYLDIYKEKNKEELNKGTFSERDDLKELEFKVLDTIFEIEDDTVRNEKLNEFVEYKEYILEELTINKKSANRNNFILLGCTFVVIISMMIVKNI